MILSFHPVYLFSSFFHLSHSISQHASALSMFLLLLVNLVTMYCNLCLCYCAINHFLLQVLQQLREKALKRAKLTEDQVLQKIEGRAVARKNRDYEKSDAIRKDLATLGIALMDSPDGTSWRPAVPLALQQQQFAAS